MEAAKHVLQDLDEHGMLHLLLDGSSDGKPQPSPQSKPTPDAQDAPPRDQQQQDQTASSSTAPTPFADHADGVSSFPVSPTSTEGSDDDHQEESQRRGTLHAEAQGAPDGDKADARWGQTSPSQFILAQPLHQS